MHAIQTSNSKRGCAALDLQAEMRHWRTSYPDHRFFRSGLKFERYLATFKFGYDTFLRQHGKDSTERFRSLCHQYKDGVPARDRIDWADAEMIVAATWERMKDNERLSATH